MKVVYLVLVMSILVSGFYVYTQIQRRVDKSISKTEVQYMECINRGNDAQGCAIEQLMLRGLVCKS